MPIGCAWAHAVAAYESPFRACSLLVPGHNPSKPHPMQQLKHLWLSVEESAQIRLQVPLGLSTALTGQLGAAPVVMVDRHVGHGALSEQGDGEPVQGICVCCRGCVQVPQGPGRRDPYCAGGWCRRAVQVGHVCACAHTFVRTNMHTQMPTVCSPNCFLHWSAWHTITCITCWSQH